jgi:hypothetical protein
MRRFELPICSYGSEQSLLSYGAREFGGGNDQKHVTANYFANSNNTH